MTSFSRFLLLSLGLSYGATQAHAAGFTDLAAIDREVASFTGKSIGQSGGAQAPVDRRLRLAACQSPLMYSWHNARHDTVAVACPDPGSWHLYVPVRSIDPGVVAVARGESVSIAVVGEDFSIEQPGEAMDSGAIGDWIRVRGVKSGSPQGEPIRARIARPGQVEVPIRD